MKNLFSVLAILVLFVASISTLSAQKSTSPSTNLGVTFDYPKPNSFIRDSLFWVKIDPKEPKNISSIDLYINNRSVGRDTRYPFAWGKGSGLRGGPKVLKPGTYKLKAVITDKKGGKTTQYSTFKVRGR